jgi:hypothetical protein
LTFEFADIPLKNLLDVPSWILFLYICLSLDSNELITQLKP